MTRNTHISEELNTFAEAGKKEYCRREFSDEGYGDGDNCGGGGAVTSTTMAAKLEFTCEGSDSGIESSVGGGGGGGCQRCRTTEGGDSETEAGCVIGSSNGVNARKMSLGEGEPNGGGVGGGCGERALSSTASENGSESSSVEDAKRNATCGVNVVVSGCVVGSPSKILYNPYAIAGSSCKSSRKSSSASSSCGNGRPKITFTGDALRFGSPKPTTSRMPPFEYETTKSRYSSSEGKNDRLLQSYSMTRAARTPTTSPDEPLSAAKWATAERRASSRSRLTCGGGGGGGVTTTVKCEKVASSTFEAYATLPRRKPHKEGGDAKTPREPSLNRAASLRKKFLENNLMTTSFNGAYSSTTTLTSLSSSPSYVKSKPPSKTKIYLEATTQTALTNSDVEHALSDHPFQLYNNLDIQEDAEYRIKKYYEEQMTSSTDEIKKLKKEHCKQRTVIEWLEGELAASKDEKFTTQNKLATIEQRLYSLLRHKSPDGDDVLEQLEREVGYSNSVISQQQEEIAELQQMCCILKKDLEKSYSVQKTLVESQKATEMESMELQEFMQAEKSTLTDSLRDTELELKTCRARLTETERELTDTKNELAGVRTICEELRRENTATGARLCNLERRCRELLLHQGAAISSASVALSGLGSRFEQLLEQLQLVSSHDISDADLQDESQENQFSVDENGTNCSATVGGSEDEVVRRKASRKWLKAIGSAISKTFTEKQDRGIAEQSNGPAAASAISRKNSRLKNVASLSSFEEEEDAAAADDGKRRESTFNLISTSNDDPLSLLKLEADSRRSSILTEVCAGADNLTLDFGTTTDELPSDTTDIKRDLLLLNDYSTQEVSLVEQINEMDNLIGKAFKAITTATGAVPKEKSQFETTDANGEVTGETKRNDGIGSVSKFANKLVKENGRTVPNGQYMPAHSNKYEDNETIAYLRMQQKAIKNTLGMLHKMPETVDESVFLKRIQTDLENVNQLCETFLSTAGNEITK